MTERVINGTTAFVLKPSSIVGAANADIERYQRNTKPQTGSYEDYAFHRYHVAKAMKPGRMATPKRLIEIAVGDIERGQTSGKHWTRVIYSDPDLLRQALEVA